MLRSSDIRVGVCEEIKMGEEKAGEGKKEEDEKSTLDSFSGGTRGSDDELEEYGEEVSAKLGTEEKELNEKIVAIVSAMSVPDESEFYAWLESIFGVRQIAILNLQDKRKVLEEMEKGTAKRSGEELGGKLMPRSIRGGQIEKIVALQDELQISMKKILAWIDKKFAAKKLEELSEDQAETVIHTLKATKEKRESEKGKEEQKEVKTEKKVIGIEWDKIPAQMLIPKLERALEYESVLLANEEQDSEEGWMRDTYEVVKKGETTGHITTFGSCDCKDWANRGTSLTPCVHMVRIKYRDDEIQKKLAELQPSGNTPVQQLPAGVIKEGGQPSVFSGISQLQPRLCEIGKIKIGELSERRTTGGRRLPKKLDHFVITSLLRDEEGDLLLDEEMNKKIGNNCRELDIYLAYDSPELNMPTFYGYFTQSKLRCMGDGVTALRTTEEGDKEEIVCNPKTCEYFKQKQCKPYGRLSVILSSADRIGGSYVFRTTSWNTLRNILTSMAFIRRISGGVLAGLPLKMRLMPMQVQPKELGRTVRIYTVNIEFDGSMTALMDAAEQEVKRRIQMGTNMKQIEAEDSKEIAERVREEAEERAAEISEEFVPEEEG